MWFSMDMMVSVTGSVGCAGSRMDVLVLVLHSVF
jgi:hypothetical protein